MWVYDQKSGELYHYGVKGMKWGVRRFQDKSGRLTAAGKKRQAKRDQRAEKYYERARGNQREIDALNKSLNSTTKRLEKRKIQKDINKLEKERDRNEEIAEAKKEGKLTKRQKAALIGAGVVAAYATYKFVDSGNARRLITKGKAAVNNTEFGFKKNSDLARGDMDADEIFSTVVGRINPGYGGVGTKNNCRRCTFAYEMSRRGYDVKATKTLDGTGQSAVGLHNATSKNVMGKWSYLTKTVRAGVDDKYTFDTKVKDVANFSSIGKSDSDKSYTRAIFDTLSKQPNGARGELSVTWSVGGGHSMAWEVIKGKPVIFDCQTGTKYDTIESFSRCGDMVKSAGFSRLDNIELNEDFLLRWVKNA